jgi:U4/U6 small nuclear ribonucleoprotein PRP31
VTSVHHKRRRERRGDERATMATIAEELLNDFEDGGEMDVDLADVEDSLKYFGGDMTGMDMGSDQEPPDGQMEVATSAPTAKRNEPEDEEETKARVEKMQLHNVEDVRSVALLMQQLQPVMEVSHPHPHPHPPPMRLSRPFTRRTDLTLLSYLQQIEYYKSLPPEQQAKNEGNVEENPEYRLLTKSNSMSTQIDGEIVLVHKFIRDHYSVRFPELETLIKNPLDYAKAVAIIGNGPMEGIKEISESTDNMFGQTLRSVLDGPSFMVVVLEAVDTKGTPLSNKELVNIRAACKMILDLDNAKTTLTEYVQSRMSFFAPNLTTLIGPVTAAQLVNHAGGISALARTPPCNIPSIGSKKNTRAIGLATNIGVKHQGFLYQNKIVKDVPSGIKKQAMRILAAKIVLSARVDMLHEAPAGDTGLTFYEEVEKRIAKLQEAGPNRGHRALPAPDDKPSRKRGGRRARKAKESVAVTQLRKAQNMMAFGTEEAEVGFGGVTVGLGMIGAQELGRVRKTQVDQRTKAKLGKKNPGWGGSTPPIGGTATQLGRAGGLMPSGLRTAGVGGSGMKTMLGAASGTVSTVAFTPSQGLELVDPKVREDMNRKRKAEEDRYFGNGTFTQVQSKKDGDGFTLPGLPASKKQKEG